MYNATATLLQKGTNAEYKRFYFTHLMGATFDINVQRRKKAQ